MKYYRDKRIWITGASSGIGKALVEALVIAGSRLIITARRENLLEDLKNDAAVPENVEILPGDMSELDTLEELSLRAWKVFGGLDMVILNAGVSQRSLFIDTEFETGKKLFDINFFSQTKIISTILPFMKASGCGHIVAVTSLSALIPSPLRIYYSSAKHAMHGFYDTLRVEVCNSGIGVSLIVPGFVKTDISYNSLTGSGAAFGALDPLQKNGASPEKVIRKILRQLSKKKREIYIGYTPNAIIARFLGRYFPGLLIRILRNMNKV
jgi:short-subunit dehydrogenase